VFWCFKFWSFLQSKSAKSAKSAKPAIPGLRLWTPQIYGAATGVTYLYSLPLLVFWCFKCHNSHRKFPNGWITIAFVFQARHRQRFIAYNALYHWGYRPIRVRPLQSIPSSRGVYRKGLGGHSPTFLKVGVDGVQKLCQLLGHPVCTWGR